MIPVDNMVNTNVIYLTVKCLKSPYPGINGEIVPSYCGAMPQAFGGNGHLAGIPPNIPFRTIQAEYLEESRGVIAFNNINENTQFPNIHGDTRIDELKAVPHTNPNTGIVSTYRFYKTSDITVNDSWPVDYNGWNNPQPIPAKPNDYKETCGVIKVTKPVGNDVATSENIFKYLVLASKNIQNYIGGTQENIRKLANGINLQNPGIRLKTYNQNEAERVDKLRVSITDFWKSDTFNEILRCWNFQQFVRLPQAQIPQLSDGILNLLVAQINQDI